MYNEREASGGMGGRKLLPAHKLGMKGRRTGKAGDTDGYEAMQHNTKGC